MSQYYRDISNMRASGFLSIASRCVRKTSASPSRSDVSSASTIITIISRVDRLSSRMTVTSRLARRRMAHAVFPRCASGVAKKRKPRDGPAAARCDEAVLLSLTTFQP
jgi:hypothetical protein